MGGKYFPFASPVCKNTGYLLKSEHNEEQPGERQTSTLKLTLLAKLPKVRVDDGGSLSTLKFRMSSTPPEDSTSFRKARNARQREKFSEFLFVLDVEYAELFGTGDTKPFSLFWYPRTGNLLSTFSK